MNTTTKPPISPGAKLAIDFGPLLIFFLVNMFAPVSGIEKIFVATGAFMIATILAMIGSKLAHGAISLMLWFNGAMVVLFGGATLWLHDATFIKVKPTIYYVMLAAILFFGLVAKRPTLKLVLGSAYPGLTERGWTILSRNWAWFFAAMAIANEAVWRHVSTDAWVAFKLWGALPATIIFAFANVPLLMRHGMGDDAAEKEMAQVPPEG
jgi:intracellular septation protein